MTPRQRITCTICKTGIKHGLTFDTMMKRRPRFPAIVKAREECFVALYKRNEFSIPQVAKVFGLDQTTVGYHLRKGRS